MPAPSPAPKPGPIQLLEEKLRKHPELRVERRAGTIRVLPAAADGFEVSLLERPGAPAMVCMEGWHEEFERPEEAVACFGAGVSGHARLRVVSRGGFDCSWTVERLEKGAWVPLSTTGLLFFPFWRRPVTRYLRNHAPGAAPP